jgi:hypothetical protein
MGYLARPDAVARRADLRGTLPSVRSVVVVGLDYRTAEPDASERDPSRGVIARYARGRDYHRTLKGKLVRLAQRIERGAGRPVVARAYVDTGPILERDLARRAGLGWFGKNTMLIHPRRGSYFFLGVLLLDLDLATDEPLLGGSLRQLRALPRGVPDRSAARPRRARRRRDRRDPLHLLPDHRAARTDPARAARGARQPHLRLRHLPGGLPVQRSEVRAADARARLHAPDADVVSRAART